MLDREIKKSPSRVELILSSTTNRLDSRATEDEDKGEVLHHKGEGRKSFNPLRKI